VQQLSAAEHKSRAATLATEVGATALVVADREQVLLATGEPSVPVHCRSIRKSLLGALFGRRVLSGSVDLDATLADRGIDDIVPPPLTEDGRTARVRDLLTCRSGVYHPSNHQPPTDRAALPPRGSRRPGTHFVYNNWDFNALGTILARRTGLRVGEAFQRRIAAPLGMDDFGVDDDNYREALGMLLERPAVLAERRDRLSALGGEESLETLKRQEAACERAYRSG